MDWTHDGGAKGVGQGTSRSPCRDMGKRRNAARRPWEPRPAGQDAANRCFEAPMALAAGSCVGSSDCLSRSQSANPAGMCCTLPFTDKRRMTSARSGYCWASASAMPASKQPPVNPGAMVQPNSA